MTRLLKETTKELDLIDPAICTFVWRVCNNMLFEKTFYILRHLSHSRHCIFTLQKLKCRKYQFLCYNPLLHQKYQSNLL